MPLSINAIADKLTPAAQASLVNAMRAMSQQVSIPALTAAIKKGNIGAALKAIKSTQLPQHLKPFATIIGDVFQQAASMTMEPFVDVDPTFTKKNPLAQAAADWSGQKITVITEETRTAIRKLIRKGLTDGIEPAKLAKEIKPLIGLNARQAIAVQNARAAWVKSGMTADAIEKASGKLIDKQRNYRALMIARTETIGASNRGQLHGWRAGAKAGLLDPNVTKRKWIAAKGSSRTCDICNAMNGSLVIGLHSFFNTPKGQLQHPPLHPNCRCTIALVIDQSRAKLPQTFNAPPPVEAFPAVTPPQAVMPEEDSYAKALAEQQAAQEAAALAKLALKKQKAKEAQARFRAKKKLEKEAAKKATLEQNPDVFSWDEYTKADQILHSEVGHDPAVRAKMDVQSALHDRLKNSNAPVVMNYYNEKLGRYDFHVGPFNELPEQARKDWIRERISKWAGTSGDHDADAVAMQIAVREEFGLANADMSHFSASTVREAQGVYQNSGQAYREFVRAMHDNTQEYFTHHGVTHLTLVRGARYSTPQHDGWGYVKLQPASSFSTDVKTSMDFGNTMHVVRIPVNQLLGSARTGFGCLSEHEFVVLGGELRAWNSNLSTINKFGGGGSTWKKAIEDAIKEGTPK